MDTLWVLNGNQEYVPSDWIKEENRLKDGLKQT